MYCSRCSILARASVSESWQFDKLLRRRSPCFGLDVLVAATSSSRFKYGPRRWLHKRRIEGLFLQLKHYCREKSMRKNSKCTATEDLQRYNLHCPSLNVYFWGASKSVWLYTYIPSPIFALTSHCLCVAHNALATKISQESEIYGNSRASTNDWFWFIWSIKHQTRSNIFFFFFIISTKLKAIQFTMIILRNWNQNLKHEVKIPFKKSFLLNNKESEKEYYK